MDDDEDMFEWETRTRSRLTDPITSHEAAASVMHKMTKIRREVLHYFVRRQWMTDLDLQIHFEHHGSTYRTRRSELTEMGYIADSGAKQVQGGSNRIVWTITELGKKAAGLFPIE